MIRDQIDCILLIAGPAGVGKSTFIQQLSTGQLPNEIEDLFPTDCRTWPIISGKGFLSSGLPDTSRSGVVMHYDIMRPYTKGFRSYETDPALAFIESALSLVVVTLSVPPQVLVTQYMKRAMDYPSLGNGDVSIYSLWRKKLRIKAYQITGSRSILLGWKKSRLVRLYERCDTLNHWVYRWQKYLETLCGGGSRCKGQPLRMIAIAPRQSKTGKQCFELLQVMESENASTDCDNRPTNARKA